jgi:hypothetical protein
MQPGAENVTFVETLGRRSGVDRRTFSYTCHIPERRRGTDRRSGRDRRKNKRLCIVAEIEVNQPSDLQWTVSLP